MYIQKAEIKNIRSITDFEIEFKNPAGWHVLIGDNGAGKSTIIRSMALALIGDIQAQGLRADWSDWLKKQSKEGYIKLRLFINKEFDSIQKSRTGQITKILGREVLKVTGTFKKHQDTRVLYLYEDENIDRSLGFFSVAYGPYRRFDSGNEQWIKVFENPSFAKLAAHLSMFDKDVAFTEVMSWLKYLHYQSLENNQNSRYILKNIEKLINYQEGEESFLPHNAKLESVGSGGVFFKDGNGEIIPINQLSDGYHSGLSLFFELIRQLVRVYDSEAVFKNIEAGEMKIDLPGVVLVDEIDAHLHPTWQTRIGNWFLKYFPQLQFIVTTHSPLVCRAAERGSIWRLAAPGSDEKSGEVTGVDRERLIYGNILDAYGTEVFGEDISISQDSVEKQEQLVKLNKKKMLDAISPAEEKKLEDLKKVFITDAQIEL